uniref:Uncharacterized protein n=1 Tax=viral metagenome TaxID=1070528 RepID=A0A6H2A272_9ZZZZ
MATDSYTYGLSREEGQRLLVYRRALSAARTLLPHSPATHEVTAALSLALLDLLNLRDERRRDESRHQEEEHVEAMREEASRG